MPEPEHISITLRTTKPSPRLEISSSWATLPSLPGSGVIRLARPFLLMDLRQTVLRGALASLFLVPYHMEPYDEELAEAVHNYRKSILELSSCIIRDWLGEYISGKISFRAMVPILVYASWHGGQVNSFISCVKPEILEEEYKPLLDASQYYVKTGDDRYMLDMSRECRTNIPIRIPVLLPPGLPHCPAVDPGDYIGAPEGYLTLTCRDPTTILEEKLGCKAKCRRGHIIASSMVCTCGNKKLVMKDYSIMSLKWIPLFLVARTAYKYRTTPGERMEAEYVYFPKLREIPGVRAPEMILVCRRGQGHAFTVRTYLPGVPLLEAKNNLSWRFAGSMLYKIHMHGYVLGDANPGNFLVDSPVEPRVLGVIDAEQAMPYSLQGAAWDLVTLISTSIVFRVDDRQILAILGSYSGSGGKEVLEEASKSRLWAGIRVVAPLVYTRGVSLVKKALGVS